MVLATNTGTCKHCGEPIALALGRVWASQKDGELDCSKRPEFPRDHVPGFLGASGRADYEAQRDF